MAKIKKKELTLEEKLEQALVPEDEWPYEVPDNWCWTKIGIVSKLYRGVSYKKCDAKNIKGDNDCLIMRGGNIKEGQIDLFAEDNVYINKSMVSENQLVKKNDIIIVSSTGSTKVIGRAGISDADYLDVSFGAFLTLVRPIDAVCKRFVALYFQSDNYRNRIRKLASGVNINNIKHEYITETSIPLPPLAEQQRIVDRIESLFAKLDQAKELAQNALDNYKTRRDAILHKAFTGELTAKWREKSSLESIEKRLKDIIKCRFRSGDITKEISNYINELTVDDVSDSKGWLHLKTMLICHSITCGGTPSGFIFDKGEIPFLKVYNIVNNKIAFKEKPQFINIETHKGKLKASKLKPKDVVMNIVGPPLRKIAIIPEDYAEWNMNQAIVRFRTIENILPQYLYYCLIYPPTLNQVINDTKGVVGQANISIKQSRNIIIPVPSLPEQKEIARILDSLFEKEQKAKELYDVIEKIDLMKKAILARAFRGELGTNDPNEESAVELLKEVLKDK